MMFNTDRAKPLCKNKSKKEMATINKQRNKSGTDSKFMNMNNINIKKLFFLWDLVTNIDH